MAGYDRALTVFTQGGRLNQVDYAMEAVHQGAPVIGVKGQNCIVIAAERRCTPKLQIISKATKIENIDDIIAIAFSGMHADARVIKDLTRSIMLSYRMTFECYPSVDYVAQSVGKAQQEETHKAGARPYGASILLAGRNKFGNQTIYVCDPSGAAIEWNASAIGSRSSDVLTYLEKSYKPDLTDEQSLQLALEAISEVVDATADNLEVLIYKGIGDCQRLESEEIEKALKLVSKEGNTNHK